MTVCKFRKKKITANEVKKSVSLRAAIRIDENIFLRTVRETSAHASTLLEIVIKSCFERFPKARNGGEKKTSLCVFTTMFRQHVKGITDYESTESRHLGIRTSVSSLSENS